MANARFGNPYPFDPRMVPFQRPPLRPPFPPPFMSPILFGWRPDPGFLKKMDIERCKMLVQFMMDEGLEPSHEEEMVRKDVILQLKQIVMAWAKEVGVKHGLPEELISSIGATIVPYGSYGLGVHGSGSDIDALCIGPAIATLEDDFFVLLHDMLQSQKEVADIHCIKTAKVPLMRFKFSGISVDFPYAQLQAITIYDDVDLFDNKLEVSDVTSRRSISGVRANKCILKLVPNLKSFQAVLRCVKYWAKKRGIYSHLLGFLGGIHLAILVAHVCQRFPNASISALLTIFFNCFSHGEWPVPVILQGKYPKFRHPGTLMPIMMPFRKASWCSSNITHSTFQKITSEFHRGFVITQDIRCTWSGLFQPFEYQKCFKYFLRILLSAPDEDSLRDWSGWVKSRFKSLLRKLEEVQNYCDPNPTEYVDPNMTSPNVLFYWGLSYDAFDPAAVKESFMRSVNREKYSNANTNPCILELSIVKADKFPDSLNYIKSERETESYTVK